MSRILIIGICLVIGVLISENSEEDAMRLASRREAKLEYYENTGRLIAIR